MLEISNT